METKFISRKFPQETKDGHCIFCKCKIIGFKDKLSIKEFHISGLCQTCQDKVFGETP